MSEPYKRGTCNNAPEGLFALFFIAMILYVGISTCMKRDVPPPSSHGDPQIMKVLRTAGAHDIWTNGYVYKFTYMDADWKVIDQASRAIITYSIPNTDTLRQEHITAPVDAAIKTALKEYKSRFKIKTE